MTGLGVGPRVVDRVIGVAKAFTTRVGSGPFRRNSTARRRRGLRGMGDKPGMNWHDDGPPPRGLARLAHPASCPTSQQPVGTGSTKLDIPSVDWRTFRSASPTNWMAGGWSHFRPENVGLLPADSARPAGPGRGHHRRATTVRFAGRRAMVRGVFICGAGAPVSHVSVGPGRAQFIEME